MPRAAAAGAGETARAAPTHAVLTQADGGLGEDDRQLSPAHLLAKLAEALEVGGVGRFQHAHHASDVGAVKLASRRLKLLGGARPELDFGEQPEVGAVDRFVLGRGGGVSGEIRNRVTGWLGGRGEIEMSLLGLRLRLCRFGW